jgi:hypothetical protein
VVEFTGREPRCRSSRRATKGSASSADLEL